MTSDQRGYFKCDQCVTAGDLSKKDVYYIAAEKKVRCAIHGGNDGVLLVKNDAEARTMGRLQTAYTE